jgi:hypothetical protein
MPTEHIVQLLIVERDRLDAAISALRGTKRRGRPPKNPLANAPDWVTGKKPAEIQTKKRGRRYSLAARKRQAAKMRLYWKNKKKQTKTSAATA